jgi:hypothetical protein
MRIDDFDWTEVASSLDRQGWAILPGLLAVDQCDAIAGMYGDSPAFHSHVVMARHGFGRGEYRYFSYPLPDPCRRCGRRSIQNSPRSRTAGTIAWGWP